MEYTLEQMTTYAESWRKLAASRGELLLRIDARVRSWPGACPVCGETPARSHHPACELMVLSHQAGAEQQQYLKDLKAHFKEVLERHNIPMEEMYPSLVPLSKQLGELECPECGRLVQTLELGQAIPKEANCPYCQIDFQVDELDYHIVTVAE